MYKLELNNRKSIRLKQYDYSRQGMYFITICVKNRECILSKINYKRGVGVDDHVDLQISDLRKDSRKYDIEYKKIL